MISKFRTPVAFLVSAVWLAMLWFFVVEPKGGLASLLAKDMNNIGDFLSGAFAPLAFFWFVIAYWQQSDELRETRAEIKRQADSIAANELHARKDTFFRYIDILLSEQNAVLARILGATTNIDTESTWNRYAAGNKETFNNMFVLYFVLKFDEIKENSLDHNERKRFIFNRNAEKFIRNFEHICEKADECDASLRALYESSAMGRAYKGLCFILGQTQKLKYSSALVNLDELKS